jgi:phage tail sheath protein FI
LPALVGIDLGVGVHEVDLRDDLRRCGYDTMTQNDIGSGRPICEVGIAPVKPAEFVIFCM